MPKILFIPNTVAQIQKFKPVIDALPQGTDYLVVVLDRFKSDNALPLVKGLGLPYRELQGMDEKSISKLLKEESAGIVVIGNDDEEISRVFIGAAKTMGIPSLLMQDGTICPYNYVLPITLDFIPAALFIYGPIYLLTKTIPRMALGKLRKRNEVYRYGTRAEHVAAWGAFSKRMFVGLDANVENIHVTGAPAMDVMISRKPGRREELLRKIGADPEKKTLLFVPSDLLGGRLYTRREYQKMCDTACETVKKMQDVQMIIKPHPSFSRREPHYFDKYKTHNIFVSMENPYELLRAADAVVAEISTMILEAVAFGKPVLIVNVTGRGFPSDPYPKIYVDAGVATLLEDGARAAEAVRGVLFDAKTITAIRSRQPAFIEDQLFRLDGKSAQRIVELIMKLMKKEKG